MNARPQQALAMRGRHLPHPRGGWRVMLAAGWLILSLLVGQDALAAAAGGSAAGTGADAAQGNVLGNAELLGCAADSSAPSCCVAACSCCQPAGPASCPCAEDEDPAPAKLPWAPGPSSSPEAGGLGGALTAAARLEHPVRPACESTAPRPGRGAAPPWARQRAGKARARLACWRL